MSERLQVPRGTYDVLPDDADARAALEATALRILGGAGFRRIETPAFEYTDVFARGVGASTDIVQKEMYTFDDGGGRSVTLRPEGTAPICRAYAEHGMHKLPQPVKLWYLSSFFRQEKPQAGRFRQFWQIGAETIGSDDPAVDAEIIALLATLLEELEVGGLRLRIASLGTPSRRAQYRARTAGPPSPIHRQAQRRGAGANRAESPACVRLRPPRNARGHGNRATSLDSLDAADAEHFASVRELLDRAEIDYAVDPTLVRGLDYYTRTVFEFTSDALGAQSGVAGGGRYDGLVEMLGGPPTPGCGFAAGIERMLLASGGRPVGSPPVDLFVAFDDLAQRAAAFAVVDEARRARLNAQIELAGRSRKGQLKHADRIGARYVALVGDDMTVLKDMQAGEQRDVAAGEVVARVLRDRGMR